MSQLFHDSGPAACGQKVMLATVAYDSPDASYTYSIQKARATLSAGSIDSAYLLLSGNCHVDDARNRVVQEFLLSDCTDLVFLDADVSWQPFALLELCRYDCDIVGGVYPFRREDARANMPLRMIDGITEPNGSGLLEVEGLPAGFMRISRRAITALASEAETYWNKNDRRSKVPILFERTFENGNRWGGDLSFCRKWRALGGKVHAAYEMRLGHTAKTVLWDSLGAGLRRQAGTTLRHVCDRIRDGSEALTLFTEARVYMANPYTALEDVLALSVLMARKADGPIIETGSGLTTVLMAAATDQQVYCIEHDERWAQQLRVIANEAGVSIGLCVCPIVDGWYDLDDLDLPEHFALGLNDGPPRTHGSRMGFFPEFGHRCDNIVCDDADDPGYAKALTDWVSQNGRTVDFVDLRAALIRKEADAESVQAA